MIDIIIYLIFLRLLGMMIFSDRENRFYALFVGIVLFPLGINFIQSPTLRPMDFFLYGFLAIAILKDYPKLKKDLFSFPLLTPFLIVFFSHCITILYNSDFNKKELYAATREFIELYGFFFVAYITGKNADFKSILKKISLFALIICCFGIFEVLLNENYPYTLICRAFPIYTGYYNLSDIVSVIQDWRIRSMFTTAHPTAFGTLLLNLFIFTLLLFKQKVLPLKAEFFVAFLLVTNIILCGSRTAMLCTILGLCLLFIHKKSVFIKLLFISLCIFAIFFSAQKAIESVSIQGQGSSISLRQQQLLFTFVQIEKHPILGNGVGATKNVFEYNDDGIVINDADIGGLESAVFRTLIDYGIIGLIGYYLIFLFMFIFFYKHRKNNPYGIIGCTLVITNALFFTLSGHIGNNTAFAFLLTGLCMGKLHKDSNNLKEIESV